MSSREFGEWLAYIATVEPIGETRADIRLSMALTYISRLLGVKRVDPWWFMPYLEAPDSEAETSGDVMSRKPLQYGSDRPAAAAVEEKERKKAEELYSRLRSWAVFEQIKAERGPNGGSL